MKTSEKITFPKLENEYVENILRQLVNQYNIIQIFFTGHPSMAISYLVIHIEENIIAEQLQQDKWIKKAKKHFQINVNIIGSASLQYHYSTGNPFIVFYCRASALVYQNKELKDSFLITSEWKRYKKKFNAYRNNFYHDHDLHQQQIKNLISEDASNSVFTSYARLMEYDIEYLEELYSGKRNASLNLEERISNLAGYIPEIQRYFVKSSPGSYYLADLFIETREAILTGDSIYKNEMYGAVGIAEQGIFRLVEERLDGLKRLLRKGSPAKTETLRQVDDEPMDQIMTTAIEIILHFVEAEQIYLFHKITYGEKTTYYLMLIANGAGNEKLKVITQSLKSRLGGKYDFVLISHDSCWIQTHLYEFQSFFASVLQLRFLIYACDKYQPEFHWEVPHNPYHADLYLLYKSTKKSALQFFSIGNNPKENFQGLESLFSLFFLSFCRTFIFVKTFYLPHYLSSHALWELVIYADAGMRKNNYLIEQFWTDIFPFLDKHRMLHHKLSKLDKEEVQQMNVIVEKLMGELHELVIEGDLLTDSE